MSTHKKRLKLEYEKVRELEGRSALIRLSRLDDSNPPEKLLVTYLCAGIVGIDEKGAPIESREHVLEVELTNFPERGPQMKFRTRVFHPGVAQDDPRMVSLRGIDLSWNTPGSIAEAIVYVGHMLQYKLYENWLSSPENSFAAYWLRQTAIPQQILGPDRPLDTRELFTSAPPITADPSRAVNTSESEAQPCSGKEVSNERAGGAASGIRRDVSVQHVDPEGSVVVDTTRAAGAGPARAVEPEARLGEVASGADAADQKVGAVGGKAIGNGGGDRRSDEKKTERVRFGALTPDEHTAPFPSPRLLHWKPTSRKYEVEEPPFRLVVTSEVLATINAHVSTDLENELGGFLLGNRYVCPNEHFKYIQIDNSPDAKFTSSGPVSIDLVNKTFHHFLDEKSGKYRGKDALGWYHSHPGKGAFLSSKDIEVHKSRFPTPWTVALVVDPVRKEGGFFCWRDGEPHPGAMMDFYELRGVRTPSTITYMPWSGYECFDGQTEEERSPQLAKGAGFPTIVTDSGWRRRILTWARHKALWLGAGGSLLLLLTLGLGWYLGWFGDKGDNAVSRNNNAAATKFGGSTPRESPYLTSQNTNAASRAGGTAIIPASVNVNCEREDYNCKLVAQFTELPEELVVEVENAPVVPNIKGKTVTIDISRTGSMAALKSRSTNNSALTLLFYDAANPDMKTPFPYNLTEDMVAPKLRRVEEAEQRAIAQAATLSLARRLAERQAGMGRTKPPAAKPQKKQRKTVN